MAGTDPGGSAEAGRGWRALPAPAWALGLLAVVGATAGLWELTAIVVAVSAAAYLAQVGQRGRARRLLREHQATGGGAWVGLVPLIAAEELWGVRLPRWVLFGYDEGLPVRLVADSAGVHLHPRGLVLPRLSRIAPASIPWSDLAGARSRALGLRTTSGRSVRLVPMSAVTLDLVGTSADGRLPEPSTQELQKAFHRLGIETDEHGEPVLDEEPDALLHEEQERAERSDYYRDVYGADWQPGTEPLVLTTCEPTGLVELVAARHAGRPELDR